MEYMGSKTKLLPWIFKHVERHAELLGLGSPQDTVFLDGCSGTGAVSAEASSRGYQVVSNDLMSFASHVARGKTCLSPDRLPEARELIRELNGLSPVQGHFFREYSQEGGRMYLQKENAAHVDAVREKIRLVPSLEMQSYLYYCLIEAISQVQNTAGVQAAFLKKWQSKSKQPLHLKVEKTSWGKHNRVYNRDILELLSDDAFRTEPSEAILYLDPPYVSREYAANYHLYEAAVAPQDALVQGVTGLPNTYPRSEFCGPEEAVATFLGGVLTKTRAQLVLVSYSSDSIVPLQRMTSLMLQNGCTSVEVQIEAYKRYKADASEDRSYSQDLLQEFLIIGHRQGSGIFDLL